MTTAIEPTRLEYFREWYRALVDGRPLPPDPRDAEIRERLLRLSTPDGDATRLERIQGGKGHPVTDEDFERACAALNRPTPPAPAPPPPADAFAVAERFAGLVFTRALRPPGRALHAEVLAFLPASVAPSTLLDETGLKLQQLYPDPNHGASFILGETKVVAAPVSRVMAGNGRRYATDVYGGAEYQYIARPWYSFDEIARWTLAFHKAKTEKEARANAAAQEKRAKDIDDEKVRLQTTAERLRLMAEAVLKQNESK